MKKINKLALFTMASIFASSALIAQEADASAEDTEITAETDAVADDSETTEATEEEYSSDDWGSSDDFGGDFDDFSSDDSAPTYYINAETGVDMRGYIHTVTEVDDAKVSDMTTASNPYANMTLGYSAQSSEMEFKLKFNKNSLGEYNEDILDEATARLFLGNFVIEGGKMKVVWGKGDKLHVLDNFNANDYTDFIFGEYIDRRIAEPMLSIKFNTGNWSVQGVYTPMMTADRFASSGIWAPNAQTTLTNTISSSAQAKIAAAIETLEKTRTIANTVAAINATATNEATAQIQVMKELAELGLSTTDIQSWCLENNSTDTSKAVEALLTKKLAAANTAYTLALNNASAMSSDSSVLYPDTNQLRYGQAGVRVLGTIGSVDVGASYYYGHYKQPSFNYSKLESALETYLATGSLSEDEKFLQYDQKQTFGLEAAFVVWKFNTRWEFGYNLTKDTAGDNPWVHNNSIEWLGGFDINLFHNVSLNVQETGKYILNNNKIDGVYKKADVDYNSDDNYISNRLVVNISDTFLYENLKPEVTVIWGIENNEWCVQPKVNYKVVDGMNLGVSGGVLYCWNENGEFYNFTADSTKWHTKSFVQASVRYEF